jgi:hypothetical protein
VIPNRCIFVFLGRMEFSLVSYLAICSAATVNRPDEVVLYYERMPSGRWWELARPHVTHLVPVDPVQFVGSARLEHPAHQADVIRLERLLADGGVYLDLDVLCVRPFDPLRNEKCVLGREGVDTGGRVCNGVILAEPGSHFLKEWLAGFDPATSRWKGFRARGHDQYWNELSCLYPAHLAELFPDLVTLAPYDRFHWPLWEADHLEWVFRGKGDDFPNAYCHHLWQSLSYDPYLKELTPEYIHGVDTNFDVMARRFIDA